MLNEISYTKSNNLKIQGAFFLQIWKQNHIFPRKCHFLSCVKYSVHRGSCLGNFILKLPEILPKSSNSSWKLKINYYLRRTRIVHPYEQRTEQQIFQHSGKLLKPSASFATGRNKNNISFRLIHLIVFRFFTHLVSLLLPGVAVLFFCFSIQKTDTREKKRH